jgi:hypothetical protein
MIWEKPAVSKQLYYTILEIGLVRGVLARITAHDWRRDAAKEIANLKSKVHGVADSTTIRALGSLVKASGEVSLIIMSVTSMKTYTPREPRFSTTSNVAYFSAHHSREQS